MINNQPIPAAIAALLADRCVLMSEARTRAMLSRLQTSSTSAAADPDSSIGIWQSAIGNATPTLGQQLIAVIPVNGVLNKDCNYWGMCSTNQIMEQLAAALSDSQVTAIVLDIDSPGGFVSGTVELADAVAAANAVKPITAVIRGLCCSGAYWLASQCGKIISRAECEVGNIGVYSVLADVSKAWEAMGVDLTLIASGQFKGMGADGKVTDDLIADTRRINAGLFQQFVNAVARGRGMDADEVMTLADGRAFLGNQAIKLGLVDQLSSSFEEAIQAATGTSSDAPDSENDMSLKTVPAAQAKPVAPPAAAAQAKADDDDSKKSGQATSKVLNDTIGTANAHRDQSRKALDHCSELADDDMSEETKSLATKCVASMKAASDEASRASKAWQSKSGGDKDPKDQPSEDGGDDKDESKSLAGYVKIFGGQYGAEAFVAKKPFAAATSEFIAKLQADHKTEIEAVKAENVTLQTKLAAMPRGNEEALASVPETVQTGPNESKSTGMSDGLKRWSASLKLPNSN